jgi:hypothetical protein
MKTYKVRIVETLSRIVEIEAKDADDAIDIVDDMYRDGGIVLDAGDYDFTDYVISED